MNDKAQKHPFAPIFDSNSKVLILGSFPSPSSIEAGFYYGDSSNRFWNILGELFGKSNLKAKPKDNKIAFLKSNRIALWDNYVKYFPYCKDSCQIVCSLYSTSSASRRTGISDEILLNDYKQIKEILEK